MPCVQAAFEDALLTRAFCWRSRCDAAVEQFVFGDMMVLCLKCLIAFVSERSCSSDRYCSSCSSIVPTMKSTSCPPSTGVMSTLKSKKNTSTNLAQGKAVDDLRQTTSYFDPVGMHLRSTLERI
jgi:hypothetical protein